MSSFNPYVEDHTDAFDPGPAFEHSPGMMGPPLVFPNARTPPEYRPPKD